MSLIIEFPDGKTVNHAPDDSRDDVIRHYLKGVKMEDFAGTWSKADAAVLKDNPPSMIRVNYNGKKYLLSQVRLDMLLTYLLAVRESLWNSKWTQKETELFSSFTSVPKDGA